MKTWLKKVFKSHRDNTLTLGYAVWDRASNGCGTHLSLAQRFLLWLFIVEAREYYNDCRQRLGKKRI